MLIYFSISYERFRGDIHINFIDSDYSYPKRAPHIVHLCVPTVH